MRPGWPILIVHVGRDREADEQGGLVRVVVGQFHPDREPLDDLHEVVGRVLRRQERQGLADPFVKPLIELLPDASYCGAGSLGITRLGITRRILTVRNV